MATGHAVHIPHSLLDSVRTLTANIAAELGEAPAGSTITACSFSPARCSSSSPSPSTSPPTWSSAACAGGSARTGDRPRRTARFTRTPHVARKERSAVGREVGLLRDGRLDDRAAAADHRLPGGARRAVALLGFLVEVPRRGMREGGIWPAFVGTLYLVRTFARGRGADRRARRDLSATSTRKDNWFNRVDPPRGDQPGGRAEHRACALRPRRLRVRGALRLLDPLRLADARHHDAARSSSPARARRWPRCRSRSARPAGTSAPPAGRRSARSCCPIRSAAS